MLDQQSFLLLLRVAHSIGQLQAASSRDIRSSSKLDGDMIFGNYKFQGKRKKPLRSILCMPAPLPLLLPLYVPLTSTLLQAGHVLVLINVGRDIHLPHRKSACYTYNIYYVLVFHTSYKHDVCICIVRLK
jgi:hypothetical protein